MNIKKALAKRSLKMLGLQANVEDVSDEELYMIVMQHPLFFQLLVENCASLEEHIREEVGKIRNPPDRMPHPA